MNFITCDIVGMQPISPISKVIFRFFILLCIKKRKMSVLQYGTASSKSKIYMKIQYFGIAPTKEVRKRFYPRRVLKVSNNFTCFKGAQSRLNGLKSLAKLFKSVSIFAILNHLCSFMVYYYLFDVFLSL